jgi:hypothetical protein
MEFDWKETDRKKRKGNFGKGSSADEESASIKATTLTIKCQQVFAICPNFVRGPVSLTGPSADG